MTLSINNNTLSLQAQRQLAEHTAAATKAIAKMTSGARIDSASDDPAGQAISERMSSQLRGMSQVMRNINDGTSMLQVADSAMASIGDSLQRLRELAVQSGDGGMSDTDRGALQQEATQILAQISDVGKSTQFNGQTLFSQDTSSIGGDAKVRKVIDGLKTGWLGNAEAMIKKYYGIEGDGADLKLNLSAIDDGQWNVLASVSGSTESNGKVGTLSLNLDMSDFGSGDTADGGTSSSFYNDRTIAHEMVHAVMDRSMNMVSLPKWFKEGTAELIQGADERLAGAIAGGGVAAVVAGAAAPDPSYEGAYAASRYLHDQLKKFGVEGGMKGLMTYLHEHQSANLDTALSAVTNNNIASASAFMNDFQTNGAAFIGTMNLSNADTGAIGGLDADGGPVRNAKDVVSDIGYTSADKPLQSFNMDFGILDDGAGAGVNRMQIQVGAGTSKDDLINLEFSAMNSSALGLSDLDMKKTAVALLHIDQAIDFVDKQRVVVGAASNRLDAAAANTQTSSINLAASQSRIQDVDYASTTAKLTRSQILQQAASAMLTQANGQPSAVLALLR
ncbi:Flagellin [Massilia sp. Bi118]|uniref:flagellinolysin n=1 Tax=Massilia sp. Bi118 TaxID=2822346 RepID=UPI001DB3C8A9|nr:flagellinolysin [Massilia sp. Bi118]CAH0265437.1 Flagellin [Massilia sp. Bi118]